MYYYLKRIAHFYSTKDPCMEEKKNLLLLPVQASVCDRFFDRGKENVRNWHKMTGVVQEGSLQLMILHAGENGVLIMTKEEYNNPENCIWSYIDPSGGSNIVLSHYHARDINTGFNGLAALLSKIGLDS